MIKIVRILVLSLLTANVNAYNMSNFTTSLEVLKDVSGLIQENFIDVNINKYSHLVFFKALVLNELLIKSRVSNSKYFKDIFCSNHKDELIKILQWKVATQFSFQELNKIGVTCKKQIILNKSIMVSYFLDTDNYDALLEYYKYLKKNKSEDFFLINSVLRNAVYSKPNNEVLEILIDNYKTKKLIDGTWNASILSAKYGSEKGWANMLLLAEDHKDNIFFEGVYQLLFKQNKRGQTPLGDKP